LMGRSGPFDLNMQILEAEQETEVGDGTIRFRRIEREFGSDLYYLQVRTEQRTIHFYDESITDELQTNPDSDGGGPDLAIRAVQIPVFGKALVPHYKTLHVGR